ncbi:hypothetical protein ACEQ8H_004706 [Pleosporales sp. CAS-2024a]
MSANSTAESAASAGLNTTAIAAIATGIGLSLICIIALVVLLIRAIRNHKQLLADLEERGVSIAQAQDEARDSVTRPRSVLRRNTVFPYNKDSGWGTLTSTETFKSVETTGTVAHYVPPKPTDAMKKGSRLSWPFHTRRVSGHNIHLKRIKSSRLSTVLEDPKPSAMLPVLKSSYHDANRALLLASRSLESRHSSSQSLLRHHPAFRDSTGDLQLNHADQPRTSTSYFRTGANDRLQRAKSFADVPCDPPERPQLRARSASINGPLPGNAPDVILPPLPLDIARIKSEAKRQHQLKRIPSKQSDSSFASVDTSILLGNHHATGSPVILAPAKRRPQKITKPRTRGAESASMRPFRDSLDLRAKVLGLRPSGTPSTSPSRPDAAALTEIEHLWIATQSNNPAPEPASSRWTTSGYDVSSSSPTSSSPAKDQTNPTTPKRKLRPPPLCSDGSPDRQKRNTGRNNYNAVVRSPKRQHSQASSRSSGGNPFQWDPTPLSSQSQKPPSALKGSPRARQGHHRKNSVRISLVPTFHTPPPERTPSPSFATEKENQDDVDTMGGGGGGAAAAAENANAAAGTGTTGLGLTTTTPGPRALPTPPSSSTFAPELKFPTTSLPLPLVGLDHHQPYVVCPTDQVLRELCQMEEEEEEASHVMSNGGGTAVDPSRFPETPPSMMEPLDAGLFPLETASSDVYYAFGRDDDDKVPETPYLPQSPFIRPETPTKHETGMHLGSIAHGDDAHDPERPSIVFRTPSNQQPSRTWQSAFATIPEESSVSSQRTMDAGTPRLVDSPPVSPKTMSPPRFGLNHQAAAAAYNLPIHATMIPEQKETGGETIHPAIVGKNAFAALDGKLDDVDGTILDNAGSDTPELTLVIPRSSGLAQKTFDPLLEAAFSFELPTVRGNESPVIGHQQSEASSVYSLPSPSPIESSSPTSSPIELPSPVVPCSPRPAHAQLPQARPVMAIDFSDVPKLSPSLQGPRPSPPRPLRTSIAALRRMNSDAANARKDKAGRGERRYLRLGRESSSVPFAGDESWLDDMDDSTSIELDAAQERHLVGNILDEWDEPCTACSADDARTVHSVSTITPDTDLGSTAVEHKDTTAGAEEHSSSIWEEGGSFWASSTPPRPPSPNKPRYDHHQPVTSSPLASPAFSVPSGRTVKSKKREFAVAKDTSPTPSPKEKRANRRKRRESSERYRNRNALDNATTNVKIQVTSPSGQIVAATPGSLYDSQGFLRY